MAQVGDEPRLTPKGRATRDRIVRAAAELIVTEGLRATNMESVRKAASVSGSQATHYFADKSTLIRAVVQRQIDVVLDFHRQPALAGLQSFVDFERWIDLNMRYLRRIGTSGGTPTFHALAAQLVKSNETMHATLAAAYLQWIQLLENAIRQMKARKILVARADPRRIALVIVSAHQGGGTLAFTYRAEWPHAHATRFAINYLRLFASDPAEREARLPHRSRGRRKTSAGDAISLQLTRKGMATRARIVTAAAQLMFERGSGNTSVEEVRNAAGVSGSQIAHYFRDKRDLTRQVIASRQADVVAFHTQSRLGALDTLEDLQAWSAACIADIDAVYRRGGCIYGSLVGELIDSDDEVRDDLAAGYDQWLNLFEAGLTAMRHRGDLRPEADPRHLAVSLVVAHQGGAMLTHVTGDAEPLRVAVTAAVDYVRSFATPRNQKRSTRARRGARS
jgi:AcrR family transcriptional regulator